MHINWRLYNGGKRLLRYVVWSSFLLCFPLLNYLINSLKGRHNDIQTRNPMPRFAVGQHGFELPTLPLLVYQSTFIRKSYNYQKKYDILQTFLYWKFWFNFLIYLLNSKTKRKATCIWIQTKISSRRYIRHDLLCEQHVSGSKPHLVHQWKTGISILSFYHRRIRILHIFYI